MKGMIAIEGSLCKGCGYCMETCPKDVIALGGQFNENGFYAACILHADKCNGCALCAEICPEMAIEVWKETGEET